MRRILLFLFCAMCALAQHPEGATVRGRVTDTGGNPIAKATLILSGISRSSAGTQQSYRATTAVDGSYSFIDVGPGRYTLEAVRAGYVPAYYGADAADSQGTGLRLTAGEKMTDINMALTAAGSISGKVTDENGDPVSGVAVQVWRHARMEGGSSRLITAGVSGLPVPTGTTDNSGRYKILNVPPGTFYISASGVVGGGSDAQLFDVVGLRVYRTLYFADFAAPARPGQRPEGYLTTWYPRAGDGSLSSPVEITAGRNVSGIDIQLRKTPLFHVSGKVLAADPDYPFGPMHINVITSTGRQMPSSGQVDNVGKDGSFEEYGFPPGDYYVVANGATLATIGTRAFQKFTVADKDVDGVVVTLHAPAMVRGTLTIDGKPPGGPGSRPLTVSLEGVHDPAFLYNFQTAKVGADGSFRIVAIPGAYRIKVGAQGSSTPAPEGAYLSSALLNGVEVGDSAFNLASGPATLEIAFGSANGVIRANVQPDSHGVVSNYILIVPAPDIPGVTWPYKQYSRAYNGMFVIGELPPGTYRLYATGPVDQSTFDPDTLKQYENQSVKVTVSGSEPVFTTVQSIAAPGQ